MKQLVYIKIFAPKNLFLREGLWECSSENIYGFMHNYGLKSVENVIVVSYLLGGDKMST